MTARYNIHATEAKWQKIWAERQNFKTADGKTRPEYLTKSSLSPRGRIHMGHIRKHILDDVTERYKSAQGFNVLYSIEGLHEDNDGMRDVLKRMGVVTHASDKFTTDNLTKLVIQPNEKINASTYNFVDPKKITSSYGADTARLFMLSDSPPERSPEWTEGGIDGAWRFINRLWRMVADSNLPNAATPMPSPLSEGAEKTRRGIHRSIATVSDAFERSHFNGAVAGIRKLTNALDALDDAQPDQNWVLREGLEALSRLLGPIIPHIAAEMWEKLGHTTILCEMPWPKATPELLIEATTTIAVQVNGKLHATITLPRDPDKQEAESAALAHKNVQRALNGNPAKKVIVVPNKIVNVVA